MEEGVCGPRKGQVLERHEPSGVQVHVGGGPEDKRSINIK